MKRSEINKAIDKAIEFTRELNFVLPPFAYWTSGDWKIRSSPEYDEVKAAMLGWDVTDFGYGDFGKYGFVAFTIRNGSMASEKYKKPYAEKIIIANENQITPFHFHWYKMEDIINRGGGNLLIQLYNSSPEGEFSSDPVTVSSDGRNYEVAAGAVVRLRPGESISLQPGLYHKFWAEEGHGPVLLGEVSMLNDDNTDNRFYDDSPRFTTIEEDEAPAYTLNNEYGI